MLVLRVVGKSVKSMIVDASTVAGGGAAIVELWLVLTGVTKSSASVSVSIHAVANSSNNGSITRRLGAPMAALTVCCG